MFASRLSRRRVLRLFGTASLIAVAGCRSSPGLDSASPVTLHFLDTPFDSENTRALVAEFQSRNPSARVARVESPAGRYLTDLTTTLASGTTQDLAFVPAGSLARLVAGGWLGKLGRRSDASFLDSVELPWLREQTTLGATRYAAPAWVRLRGFFANRAYLQATGQAPPTSFDALQVAARAIQRQGLGNNAFYWPLKNGPGIFPDDYLADGGSFFDAQLAPRFASDPRYSDVLNWRLHAIWDWDLVDPRGLSNEQDNDDSFPHGWAAFAWSTYDQLRYWQTSGRFLQSGHLINALVPSRSASHLAIGAADLYAIPSSSQQSAAAWELLYYLTAGEDYRAARLRWQKSGLLFGYAPLVADNSLLATADDWADPAVLRAQLAQICAPPGVATPWRDEWLAAAQVQSALLVRRILTPAAFTQRIAQQWNSLREGWISSNGGP